MNSIEKKIISLSLVCFITNFTVFSQNLVGFQKAVSIEKQIEALKDLNPKECVVSHSKIKFRAYPQKNVNKLKNELENLGASKCKIYGNYLTGWINISIVERLKTVNNLKKITPVHMGNSASVLSRTPFTPGITTGVTTSQGDRAMLTDIFRNTHQVYGCDITVGIISNSYNLLNGAEGGVTNGDLPGVGNPNGFTTPINIISEGPASVSGNSTVDEGRAMAEIIHDIAPGAEILFYSGFNGIEDFADGYRALADAGANIIVDDVFYFVEPYFQEGIVTQAIDEVSEREVLVFTINGNYETEFSYQAGYNNRPVFAGSNSFLNFHNFNRGSNISYISNNFRVSNVPTLPITVPANTSIQLNIQWDEPSIFANPNGPMPTSNLGIMVFEQDPNNNTLHRTIEDGIFLPDSITLGFPSFRYLYTSGDTPTTIQVGIFTEGAIPQNLKIFEINQNVQIDTLIQDPTAFFHAGTAQGITVGAVRYVDTPTFNGTLIPDPFNMALGGQQLLLDRDGNRINFPQSINKPDIMAIDAGNTSFFGIDRDNDTFPNFFGTSAAAPHAAAAAALILDAFKETSNRQLTTSEVKSALNNTATDMLSEGFDFTSGNGFINTEAALQALILNENTLNTNETIIGFILDRKKINLFPLSNGFKLVNLPENTVTIKVFDLLGKEVIYKKINKIENELILNLSKHASSVYILVIETEETTITKKIII